MSIIDISITDISDAQMRIPDIVNEASPVRELASENTNIDTQDSQNERSWRRKIIEETLTAQPEINYPTLESRNITTELRDILKIALESSTRPLIESVNTIYEKILKYLQKDSDY